MYSSFFLAYYVSVVAAILFGDRRQLLCRAGQSIHVVTFYTGARFGRCVIAGEFVFVV